MKALVFSDSHGRLDNLLEVLKQHPDYEAVFHLGDVEGDEERLRSLIPYPVYMVRGNCDYFSRCKDSLLVEWGEKRIAMCHGHRQLNFGGGMEALYSFGEARRADIVMFGHTHRPLLEETGGRLYLNPGSISRPRQQPMIPTYTVLTIGEEGGIHVQMCEYTGSRP